MRSSSFTRWAWIVVACATALRLWVAASVPLSGDEAYYWEWSRRLAFGYLDHPPMVAWLIALFTLGSKSVVLIRLPFVLCGLGTAIALGAFATRTTGDGRAGAFAALVASLVPFGMIAFTMAAPDGPELFFWSLSLYFGLRATDPAQARWRFPLAAAVAATVLSSLFGFFLALGLVIALAASTRAEALQPRSVQPARYALAALALFGLLIAPYIIWDAANGWHAARFALAGRHPFVPGGNLLELLGVLAGVLTPGAFVAAIWTMGRLARGRSPGELLLTWTAAPLLAVCLVLALRERVEFNWMDGASVSLVCGLGIYAPRMSQAVRGLVAGPAAVFAVLLFAIAAFPFQSLRVAEHVFGIHLRNQGAFEIWAFEPAAHDLAKEARDSGATVMTDGYGLSSVLDFYGGIPPVVIGYDAQGREARRWRSGPVGPKAIFFDKEPLQSRPDFAMRLAQACSVVSDLGTRTYATNGQVTRTFYLTGCDGLTPAGFSLLLFADKPQG